MGDKIGRPSTYRDEYVEMAIEYATTGYVEHETVPTIIGFGLSIGKLEGQMHRWAKNHPSFRKALDVIKARQQQKLISGGLIGDYNATITKLILSANHGMHEKHETEVKGELSVFEIDYTGADPKQEA